MEFIGRKLRNAWKWYNPYATLRRLTVYVYEFDAYFRDKYRRKEYPIQSIDRFFAQKTSDVIFIFGAGSSLRDVTEEEWRKIDQYNTIGWRLFVFQEYVHADYYIIREVVWEELGTFRVGKQLAEIRRLTDQVLKNPRFQNALVIVQEGWPAVSGNRVFGYRLGSKNCDYIRFHNGQRHREAPPAETFEEGITHIYGTLSDAVNMAYIGGWKHIVLIGVDLYNMAYFNVEPGQSAPVWITPSNAEAPNSTALSGIVQLMKEWTVWLNERGVQLYIYNPRSLMSAAMPVFQWEFIEKNQPNSDTII